MNLLVILLICLIVFGGGAYRLGGPVYGMSTVTILVVILIVLALTGRL